MKKIKIMVPVLVLLVLLFSLAACGGGEKLKDAAAWGKAFTDTDAEINNQDVNLTVTAKTTTKISDGDNVTKLTANVKVVYANRKAQVGETYYERIVGATSGARVWYIYRKDTNAKYQRELSAAGPDLLSLGITEDYFPTKDDIEIFDYKNGKYVLNSNKYFKTEEAKQLGLDAKKDKIKMEISFKNGKLFRMYCFMYDHTEKSELEVEINYNFGGASVDLPAIG